MTESESEKLQHIRAHLPWYINGTLDAESTQEIERAISSSPQLRAEVDWLNSVQHKMREEKVQVADDVGLDRFNALINNEQKEKVISISSRWQQWQRPLMAIAATIMVVQMGVIGTLVNNQPEAFTTLSGDTKTANQKNVVFFQVVFNDKATSRDIQRVLNLTNAEIVGGPSALGVYTIQLSDQNTADNLSKLHQDTAIESVSQIIE